NELKRSVETLGLRGLNVQPYARRPYANDKKSYPLSYKCLEYGVPVSIHTGINYSNDRTIDHGRPINVDEVACDFPGLKINKNHPRYPTCLEYGVPVAIHTRINYSNDRTLDYGRPIYVDEVACDFPGLKIIMNHGGWPWVHESVAIARKHRSVYIEIGGIAP